MPSTEHSSPGRRRRVRDGAARATLRRMPPRFLIAEVSRLPWPHHRFKCENAAAFRGAADQGAVVAQLSPAALELCWTHTVDWRRVAAVAVQLVNDGHDHPTDDAFRAIGDELGWHRSPHLTTPRAGTASADRGAPTGRSAISGNIASDPTTSGSASVI